MKIIEEEERPSVHSAIAKEKGFTGLSILHRILHRLHTLYGFDILRDCVYDEMHNIPLNVVKHHLQHYLDTGIIAHGELEKRLRAMPWTPGNSLVCTYWVHAY